MDFFNLVGFKRSRRSKLFLNLITLNLLVTKNVKRSGQENSISGTL